MRPAALTSGQYPYLICRNPYRHQKDLVRSQRESPEAQLDARVDAICAVSAFGGGSPDPEQDFFSQLIDEQVVAAMDSLPEDFAEVLVLSDLGDLTYSEVACQRPQQHVVLSHAGGTLLRDEDGGGSAITWPTTGQKQCSWPRCHRNTHRTPYDAFLWGTPLVWQSVQPTKWMLCGLLLSANVVFILLTSSPQFDIAGWQLTQLFLALLL